MLDVQRGNGALAPVRKITAMRFDYEEPIDEKTLDEILQEKAKPTHSIVHASVISSDTQAQ